MARKRKDTGSADDFSVVAKELIEKDLPDYINEIYAPYAWSVCLDRALVYITDGLKPIQRKIIWTAKKLGITDKSARMKSATFVGRVMKYSPHGESFDVVVNMAETESEGIEKIPRPLRLPLIEGKGNFGGINRNLQPAAACFTGDTLITLTDGRSLSIKDICELVLSGEKLHVYSASTDGSIHKSPITNASCNGERRIAEVTLDNGETISCTDDHKFMLRDGTFVKARELTTGTSLMPFYTRMNSRGRFEVYDNKKCCYIGAHRIDLEKVIWSDKFKDCKTSICCHHLDLDKNNNNIDNLICLPFDAHMALHSSIVSGLQPENRERVREIFYKLVKSINEDELEDIIEFVFNWYDSLSVDEVKTIMSRGFLSDHSKKLAYKNGIGSLSKEERTDLGRKAGLKLLEKYGVEHFRNISKKGGWKKWVETHKEEQLTIVRENIKIAMEYANKPHVKARGLWRNIYGRVVKEYGSFNKANVESFLLKNKNYNTSYEKLFNHFESIEALKDSYYEKYNHKVVSVKITNRHELVYDIEVEHFHNFALTSGVFVHNSRYSEIRLTPAAMELISELDENTVEFVPNYDNTDVEPVFLPARWPVALINGVPDAMAVGYACNIPNHNPDEVMDACIALEKNPKLGFNELKKIILGPDFNCGCDIIAMRERDGVMQDGVASYMETGSGTFTMRGKYTVEEVSGRNIIKFYSLPYKIDPADVIEDIKREYEKGGFRELSEWKNLSDLEHPVLLYLETKKGINLPKLISDLYSKTKLECAFSANNTIISGEGVEARPVKFGVKDIILGFLNFRHQCTKNKLNNRIKLKEAELSKNNAIKAVSVDIDKCISIIRKANDRSEAAKKLEKAFKINEEQSKYVLSLQIGSLTKSDTIAIQKRIDELEKSLKKTKEILADPKKFSKFIISELEETKKNISSPRKCKIIKSLEEEEETKDIFLGINSNGKIYRTFKESEDVYSVNKDGKVIVITESKAFIRSIYELNDEKLAAVSKLKFPGKGLAVAASSGYLIIVGEEGSAKIVDMSSYNYPNKDVVEGIFKQKVVYATVIRELAGKLVINGNKKVKISDIPVQSMTAKNGKKISKENISSVELVQ